MNVASDQEEEVAEGINGSVHVAGLVVIIVVHGREGDKLTRGRNLGLARETQPRDVVFRHHIRVVVQESPNAIANHYPGLDGELAIAASTGTDVEIAVSGVIS